MKHPLRFTFLGFHLNSLIDSGKFLDLDLTHQKIQQKQIFPWLHEKFGDQIDVSLYTQQELSEIEEFFNGLSLNVDEKRKMGITKNGLCMLVAYCFDGAQKKITEF